MTRYHIVGIAGAGMSAMAHLLLDRGHTVSGSDMQRNHAVTLLEARGVTVRLGHDPAHIVGAEAIITTSAARADQIELLAARARGLPILKRTDLWRQWSQERPVVAVAGTHGKTTTTALITLMLLRAGMNPGYLIGAELPDLERPAQWGDPNAPLVIEADEYDQTFLALTPDLAVITNVEWDHVDSYPTPAAYATAFQTFAAQVRDPRRLVVCSDDPGIQQALQVPDAVWYGVEEGQFDPVACRRTPLDWTASNLRYEQGALLFDAWRYNQATLAIQFAGVYQTQLAGRHNVSNALAALAAAQLLKVPGKAASEALAGYQGAQRRFQRKGEIGGVTVIDDYAHHPTEARATLAAARGRYPGRRIIAYVQPHTYSRTRTLLDVWATAFDDADVVCVGAVYAARETETLGVDDTLFAGHLRHPKAYAVGGIERAALALFSLVRPGDVVVTMSAGDGVRVGELVLEYLRGNAAQQTARAEVSG